MHFYPNSLFAMYLLLLWLVVAQSAPTRFIEWSIQQAKHCGVPTSVLVLPNLYPCVTDISAVMAFHTMFEGKAHTFGVTACSDEQIVMGVRTESGGKLVYMEFVDFNDFLAFMKECVSLRALYSTNDALASHRL